MTSKYLTNGHSKYIKPNTRALRLAIYIAMPHTNDAAKSTAINQIMPKF